MSYPIFLYNYDFFLGGECLPSLSNACSFSCIVALHFLNARPFPAENTKSTMSPTMSQQKAFAHRIYRISHSSLQLARIHPSCLYNYNSHLRSPCLLYNWKAQIPFISTIRPQNTRIFPLLFAISHFLLQFHPIFLYNLCLQTPYFPRFFSLSTIRPDSFNN